MLAEALVADGHQVRGSTRDPARTAQIRATGAEAVVGDPDRVATLMPALDRVTVALILLGSAVGSTEQLAALHGSRLEMLLTKIVDTTVRAVVYESVGSVGAPLTTGAATVRSFAEEAHARCELLEADPTSPQEWLAAARGAVGAALRER